MNFPIEIKPFLTGELWRGRVSMLGELREDLDLRRWAPPTYHQSLLGTHEVQVLAFESSEKTQAFNAIRAATNWPAVEVMKRLNQLPATIPLQSARSIDDFQLAGMTVDRDRRGMPIDWQASTVHQIDGRELLERVEGIQMRDGWKLFGHAFRSEQGGHGNLWALPPHAITWYREATDLRPEGAREFGEAIQNNGTQAAWLRTSLLLREAAEFAAEGHGVNWGVKQLLKTPSEQEWKWEIDLETLKPFHASDLSPAVSILGDEVVVIFFTENHLGTIRLNCHVDRYRADSCLPRCDQFQIAAAGPGYVF